MRGAEPQAIDLIHPSLHRALVMMLMEDGHLLEVPINIAISILRDAMNPQWRLVLDVIKRRTQSEVTSVEEQVIEAVKGYRLNYDEASIALLYQEANKAIINNKGIDGELSKQEWERIYHHLKKNFIKGQHSLNQSTKVELERQLFLDQNMPNTLDDFLDILSKAWKEVRVVYVKACQVLGYHKTQHQSQGRDNDRRGRERNRSRSRSRSRSRDRKSSYPTAKRRNDTKNNGKIVGVCNKCGNNNSKSNSKWQCFKGKCKLWDHPMVNKSKETWENSENGKTLKAHGKNWLSPKLNIVNGNLVEDFPFKEVCHECINVYTLNGTSNKNSSSYHSNANSMYKRSEASKDDKEKRE